MKGQILGEMPGVKSNVRYWNEVYFFLFNYCIFTIYSRYIKTSMANSKLQAKENELSDICQRGGTNPNF
jgi:hypothetical protein